MISHWVNPLIKKDHAQSTAALTPETTTGISSIEFDKTVCLVKETEKKHTQTKNSPSYRNLGQFQQKYTTLRIVQ